MKKIKFYYCTRLTFDNDVRSHSFALRCIPVTSASQEIISCNVEFSPNTDVITSVDAFGNNICTGYIEQPHRFLDFTVRGVAKTDISKAKTDFMPCYKFQSEMTKPSLQMIDFYKQTAENLKSDDIHEKAAYFTKVVYDYMTYEKGVTDTDTTAAQVFELKKGVCQDYSHLLLSLLRMDGIPCRYMAGLAFCSGETHSWVEVFDGDKWFGVDPANNCDVNEDYIVLSQGRDCSDCSLSRGVMYGSYTKQLQLVESSLEVLYY